MATPVIVGMGHCPEESGKDEADIGQDARNRVNRFGSDELVPAGAIQGVFKPSYIEAAQETPLVFFWGHRLGDLRDFIDATR